MLDKTTSLFSLARHFMQIAFLTLSFLFLPLNIQADSVLRYILIFAWTDKALFLGFRFVIFSLKAVTGFVVY